MQRFNRDQERSKAALSRAGWTIADPPEADALSGACLPTMPQVRLVPDHEGHSKSRNRTRTNRGNRKWIEVMKLPFEEENLSPRNRKVAHCQTT